MWSFRRYHWKYNFDHFLTHSSSPKLDRAPYIVARLYAKRAWLVADKFYSWFFLLFSVIYANSDVFGRLMGANIRYGWAAFLCDGKVKDITRTGASSHKGVKYVCLQIGRAHVWTPVTCQNLVCRLLLEKKKKKKKIKNVKFVHNKTYVTQPA